MTLTTATKRIRKTIICALTVTALATPTLATAGFSSRLKTVKSNTSTLITNVRENSPIKPIANKVQGARPEIFDDIKDMQVLEQLKQAMGMIKQMQREYEYFSGGQGCAATCANFRSRVRNIIDNTLALAVEIPALNSQRDLLENLQRMSTLVDYIPPRALYLMWQTIGAKMEELEATVGDIRQTLASLPPLRDPATFGPNSVLAGGKKAMGNAHKNVCEWSAQENHYLLDLIQARLEMKAWQLKTRADLIPDVSVKAEAGATAGAAVVNGTASAAVGIKPTDALKLTLKLMAIVPERINWAIKLNRLRAKVICPSE